MTILDPRTVRLVGRGTHLDLLDAELALATGDALRVVLVLGDPGIGKTRLTNELLARHSKQVVPLTARAYPLGTTASLGLWVEALEGYLQTLDRAAITELCGPFAGDLAGLLPSVAAVSEEISVDPPRVRLLGGLALLLANISRTAPVVLVLDDVHLADGSSWEALSYLTHNLAGAPILVVLVARPIELGEQGAASEVVLALEQEGYLRKITLSALTRADMTELAGAALERDAGSQLVDWLMERSQGSPLFATGLLRALMDEGADLDAPQLNSLPEDLAERVTARLQHLGPQERATLELITVVGARVEIDELETLCGRPLDELAPTLDELVRLRLLAEVERGRELSYEIGHPLIQEAIYASLGAARRRALHRFVARSLVASGRLGAAAGHFVRSSTVGDDEAITAIRDALRQAEAREHHREALELLTALLELLPAGDRRWLDVFDAMAWQAEWVVDHRADVNWETGLAAMRRIDQLLEHSTDAVRRAAAKFHLGTFLAWGEGDLKGGIRLLEMARDLYESAGDRRGALLAENERGYVRAIAGDADAHERIAKRVAARGGEAGDRLVVLQGLSSLTHRLLWGARFTEADGVLADALERARADRRMYRVTYLLSQQAYVATLRGRHDDARELLTAGREANPAFRDTLLLDYAAAVELVAGRLDASVTNGREALAWDGGRMSRRHCFGALHAGLAALELGDLDTTRHLIELSTRVMRGQVWWLHSATPGWLTAAFAAHEGDIDEAIDGLARIAAYLGRIGMLLPAAFARADLAELVASSTRADVLDVAITAWTSPTADVASAPYAALGSFTEGADALAHARPGAARAPLSVAVHAFDTAGWLLMAARARVLLARATAPEERELAITLYSDAADAFAGCGAEARRVAVVGALDALGTAGRRARTAVAGPAALTKREREVARLAAAGLSAKDIGTRLFIGERTVETHLANTYLKLGVTGRVELARRATELGLT